MLASRLTPEEKLEESKRLIKNLRRRIKKIEGLGVTAPQYAVINFRALEQTLPKRLNTLTDKEINTLYRDLVYINSLKSSTLRGAKQVQEKFEPIKDKLVVLSKRSQKKFWQMYGKLYEKVGNTLEKFKYEIFDVNIDNVYDSRKVDDVVNELFEAYTSTEKELGGTKNVEKFKVLFTSKLSKR